MNKNSLIIIGGAVLVAVVMAMIVQAKLSPKGKKTAVGAGVEILVANKALLTGETLKAEDVHWESFSENSIFKGVIKKKDQADDKKLSVYGTPLRRNIESGEPVTMQALISDIKGSGKFLSATIAPGMRAFGVSIKAETAAGGFVSPGDYVDVILNYQINIKGEPADFSASEIQRFGSETVLSNVRVLAVDQNAKQEGHEAKVGRTVTLEVSKEGAQILAMATSMGDISLSLRRLGEQDTTADLEVPLTTDVKNSKVMQKIYSTMNKTKKSLTTVRVYNGSNAINVPVHPSEP